MSIQEIGDIECVDCGCFNVGSTICKDCANKKVKKALEQVFPTWRLKELWNMSIFYGRTDYSKFLDRIIQQREKEALKKKKQSEEFWGKIAKW